MRAPPALIVLALALALALPAAAAASPLDELVPKPRAVRGGGGWFTVSPATRVVVAPASAAALRIGDELAARLRHASGYRVPVVHGGRALPGDVRLTTSDRSLGAEGYRLAIGRSSVVLAAPHPAGLYHGLQTIRQLLPPAAERPRSPSGPLRLPTGTIRDTPRFAWRGAMLDVARHFFGVRSVERFVDLLAAYKLNRLHLHLSDDQGWRIAVPGRPRLTSVGARSSVGGGPGGFYTLADYRAIVAYARRRYVTVVPEIDMPAHTNAAALAYPALACGGKPAANTGFAPGPAWLCAGDPRVDRLAADVVGTLAAATPGPWIDIGGDEVSGIPDDRYRAFVERAQQLVGAHGKRAVGWEEIASARLESTTLVQHWQSPELAHAAVEQGAKLIMSPASRAYLDQKYDASTPLGLAWAGYVSVRDAYDWDPATEVAGVPESAVLGVEAPLWTETIATDAAIDQMAFPRLLGIAEIGWSPRAGRSWSDYRLRLAAQGPRLEAMGVRFYRTPEVPWR